MTPALYTRDGDRLVPGALTRGPWSPEAQHGGPVAALLVRQVEAVPTGPAGPMQVVRITIELLRPVPLTPLEVSGEVIRPGKKVQLVEARVSAEGQEVARARALRIRVAPVAVPAQDPVPPSPPLPDPIGPPPGNDRTAFAEAVDLRFLKGGWDDPGPVTMWSRLVVPVVAGEEASPLARTAAAADFGNGVSRILDFETHLFINPDLTVALSRVPIGEWIGFDVITRLSAHGFGQAESLIFDERGPVGRAVQSVLVDGR